MVKVKEGTVTRDNIVKIFSIVEKELLQNKDTQVYIDSRAIAIFLNDIKSQNGVKTEWKNNHSEIAPRAKYTVYEGMVGYTDVLFVATIEFNTNDYCQLKGFEVKDLNYISHLVSFKQLLLIQMN